MVVEDIDIVDLTASGPEDESKVCGGGVESGGKRTVQGSTRPITAISKRKKGTVSSPMGMISCEEEIESRDSMTML